MDNPKLKTFLENASLAYITTRDEAGTMFGAALYFWFDDDWNFYFMTKTGTKKYQNMLHHPHIALTIADEKDAVTLQGNGTVTMIEDNEKASAVMAKLVEQHREEGQPWISPISKIKSGEYAVVKFTPAWLRFADFKHCVKEKEDEHPHCFEQIIPQSEK